MIPLARFEERLARAQAALTDSGADGLLVGVGPELRWLVGYDILPLERLTMLVIPAAGRASLVVPRLEVGAAGVSPGVSGGLVELRDWAETEDPYRLVAAALAARGAPGAPARGGAPRFLVSDGLRAAFLLRLQARLVGASFDVASTLLGPLRMAKDADEQALLRRAAAAADRVVAAVCAGRLVGRTEADVAREVRDRLVTEGHDLAEFAIVAGGPNSASPHHEPGDRLIAAGEPLLLDIGGRLEGYCSDITRTVWVSGGDPARGPDAAFLALYAAVEEAQAAGRAAVQPGVAPEDVDRAARAVIEAAGHGPHFFHRLGHGIGLEVHEDPYLVSGNREPLAVGHVFSVEPGIYLEGRYGARIEDIVLCTPDGAESLNQAPRDLLVASGL